MKARSMEEALRAPLLGAAAYRVTKPAVAFKKLSAFLEQLSRK